MPTHLLIVHAENQPGAMARIAKCLADRRVNLQGFSLGPNGARLLTDEPDEAEVALTGQGMKVEAIEVAEIQLENRPGQVAGLCQALSDAGINIEHGFGVAVGGQARIFIHVDDAKRAGPVLRARAQGPVHISAGLRRI